MTGLINLIVCIACLYMSAYSLYKKDSDGLFYLTIFFLTLDNLVKTGKIYKLSLALLHMHNKVPKEFNDYNIKVEITKNTKEL